MAIVCKWEIKGTNPTVSERTSAELDDIAKKVDGELDDVFGTGSASKKKAESIIREAEEQLRYEREIAKRVGVPYIERQIAAAGTGRLSAEALRIIVKNKIISRKNIPVEISDRGIFEYKPKDLKRVTGKITPRVPVVPEVNVPRVPGARIPTPPQRPRAPVTPRIPTTPTGPRVPEVPRVPTQRPRVPKPPKQPIVRIPKVPTTAKTPSRPVITVPIPSLKSGKKKSRYPMDSFAWKQGFGWWVSMPPYSGTIGKDMIFTRTKPAGVSIGRTPAETVTKLGINVPKGNLLDLGIMDISIKKKGSKIKYTRDVKQKTKLGRPVGIPPGIQFAKGR